MRARVPSGSHGKRGHAIALQLTLRRRSSRICCRSPPFFYLIFSRSDGWLSQVRTPHPDWNARAGVGLPQSDAWNLGSRLGIPSRRRHRTSRRRNGNSGHPSDSDHDADRRPGAVPRAVPLLVQEEYRGDHRGYRRWRRRRRGCPGALSLACPRQTPQGHAGGGDGNIRQSCPTFAGEGSEERRWVSGGTPGGDLKNQRARTSVLVPRPVAVDNNVNW